MQDSVIIKARAINKSYGDYLALNDISFDVKNNEIFGIIGPDGAGKSTIIRILATLLLSDSGTCEILGFDVRRDFVKIRSFLGYMPAVFSLYMDLSIEENLNFFANIFGVSFEENYELIKPIYRSLEPFKNRKATALSGGMKQKLALCAALIHKPKILLLDEPSTGVDAVSRAEFWEILRKLKSEMCIVVSTPYMDEASLCDRIGLISQGRFGRIGTPSEIISSFDKKLYSLENLPISMLTKLRNLQGIKSAILFGDSIHLTLDSTICDDREILELERYLKQNLTSDLIIKPIYPNIEDCFMEFMR